MEITGQRFDLFKKMICDCGAPLWPDCEPEEGCYRLYCHRGHSFFFFANPRETKDNPFSRRCQYTGCTDLTESKTGKYCLKHRLIARKEVWKRATQKQTAKRRAKAELSRLILSGLPPITEFHPILTVITTTREM